MVGFVGLLGLYPYFLYTGLVASDGLYVGAGMVGSAGSGLWEIQF